MSADDAMQPDSTADELENASSTTDDVELAADQPEDSDVETDVVSEDVAASPDAIADLSEEADLETGLADAAADTVTADDMAADDMAADDVPLSMDTVAAHDLPEEGAEDLAGLDSSVDHSAPEDGVEEVRTDIGGDIDAADATDESWTETVADASAATAEIGVDEVLDRAAEADDAADYADEPAAKVADEAVNEPAGEADEVEAEADYADEAADEAADEVNEFDEVEAEADDAANYADKADYQDEVEADDQNGAEATGDAVPVAELGTAGQISEQPAEQPFQQPSEEPLADSVFVTPSIPSQILQTIQTILAIVLPILRVVTVLTLKLTIRVLQFVVDLLDEPQSTPAATSDQPAAPRAAQEFSSESRRSAIAYSAADLANSPTDNDEPDVKRVRFTIDDIYQDDGSLRPLPDRVREIWQDLIRVMRAPLPTAMNEQIPDKVFSFILAAVLAIVVWNLVIFILPFHPAPRPAKVAEPQPTQVAQPTQDKSNADRATQSEPGTAPAPEVAPPIAPSTEPAPAQPAPAPAPTATPQLELEPQEALIEAIQEQVSDVTQRYADNLIQSVQANFRDGRLTVRVSDDWYRLAASQQDQVATDLLKRTKTLDFGKLELIDSQDNRVARSPIVGSKMLILQRDRTDITGPIGTTEPEPAQPDLPTDNAASSAESSTDAAATTSSAGDSDV